MKEATRVLQERWHLNDNAMLWYGFPATPCCSIQRTSRVRAGCGRVWPRESRWSLKAARCEGRKESSVRASKMRDCEGQGSPQGILPLRWCEGGGRGELCGVTWVPVQRVVGTGLKAFSIGNRGNLTGWGRKWQVVFLFVGHSGS